MQYLENTIQEISSQGAPNSQAFSVPKSYPGVLPADISINTIKVLSLLHITVEVDDDA